MNTLTRIILVLILCFTSTSVFADTCKKNNAAFWDQFEVVEEAPVKPALRKNKYKPPYKRISTPIATSPATVIVYQEPMYTNKRNLGYIQAENINQEIQERRLIEMEGKINQLELERDMRSYSPPIYAPRFYNPYFFE
jgi:hypothetical protein